MSILDTFFIMFEGDAKGAEAASKKAEAAGVGAAHNITKAMAEQVVETKIAEHEVGILRHHLGLLHEQGHKFFEELLVAYASYEVFEKLAESVTHTAEEMHKLGETAELLGVSVTTLDQYGQMAIRTGGSVEEFNNTLIRMQTQLARLDAGSSSRIKRIFESMGISPESNGKLKTSFQLLDELHGKFQGMDNAKSAGLGRAIGLDPATIRLLQMTNEEYDKLKNHVVALGLATYENVKVSKEYIDVQKDMDQGWREVEMTLGALVLPALSYILEELGKFFEWTATHKNLIVGFFEAIGVAALVAGIYIAIAFWPITLIVAAVLGIAAAFALVYDDIVTYMHGGKSVIGEVLNWIKQEWGKVPDFFQGILETIVGLFTGNFDKVVEGFTKVINGIKNAWNAFVGWFRSNPLPSPTEGDMPTGRGFGGPDQPDSGGKGAVGPWGLLGTLIPKSGWKPYDTDAGQRMLSDSSVAQDLVSGAATGGKNVTVVQNNSATLQVTTNTNETGETFGQKAKAALEEHYNEVLMQYATGLVQ